MIAYDGQRMPNQVKLDKKQLQQIHEAGSAFVNSEGRIVLVSRDDLRYLKNDRKHISIERSACN